MTDAEEKIIEISNLINQLMIKIGTDDTIWFFSIKIKDKMAFSGNGCPRCAVGNINQWAEEKHIAHLKDESEATVN